MVKNVWLSQLLLLICYKDVSGLYPKMNNPQKIKLVGDLSSIITKEYLMCNTKPQDSI